MKQLGKVLNKTSWAQASNTINTNSESVFSAVTMLENAAFKHKGYFLTGEEVEQLYPSAEEGSQAFVYNSSNPSTAPYDIYQMVGGTWADTGLNGGSVSVDLTKKQDTLVGYSESVSGGKATQVAIQGDAIALSGKVSLGNVDDMESAILMSSSQAGAAVAKANTVEQSMSALKSPVKPIHLNSQGKLELNIGKGLYIEDGKLCTTGASGGGGGGTTLSEGDGIRIYNDTINVEYDIDTLRVNSCGGLTVNYGEGLTIKNGKLSAQASVNAGNGLVKKGDALQVSVGTGLLVADEVYVNMGKGLATDNENKVNVNLDEQTLTTDSSGKIIVNKDSLIGNGLKQEFSKLAVNYGAGLALSNKALVVNYGTGLSIQDGKLVSTAQGGKTYVAGEAIGFDGNNINVRYDGVTISTKNTTDRSLHVMLGSGLKQGSNGIDVAVGAGLAIGSDNKLYSTVSSGKTYTAGDGIDIKGNKIAVLYGSGLTTNTCGKLIVDAANLTVGYADYAYYAPTSCSAQYASYAESADHAAVSCSASYASSAGKATADANGNNIADTYLKSVGASGDGISISGGKIAVKYGTGLGKSTDNKLQVQLGTGLAVEGNYIRVEEAVYASIEEANAGVSRAHEVVTKLQTALGGKQNTLTLATGLEWGKTDMIQVKMNAPLNYDEGGRLKLNYDSTLTVSDGKLGVDLYDVMDSGGGLFIKNTGLAVNVGRGLKIDSCQVVVDYGTGLKVVNNKLDVDTSKIAGVGIDLDSDYKMLTIGTKAAQELAGKGLVADGSKIKVKYGSGLTTNSCGNLIVDAANLTVGNADKLGGNGIGNFMTFSNNGGNYVGADFNNSTLSKVAAEKCIEFWGGAGGWFNSVWGKVTANSGFVGNLTGTADTANGAYNMNIGFATQQDACVPDGFNTMRIFRVSGSNATYTGGDDGWILAFKWAQGNYVTQIYIDVDPTHIMSIRHRRSDSTWTEWKRVAFTDQIIASVTNGLEINNDRELFLPNLTSTLAGNAVDGSKNGAQRVLNLSCGAIQIKLSTGLAIDDNGYLYVQDKYVTK